MLCRESIRVFKVDHRTNSSIPRFECTVYLLLSWRSDGSAISGFFRWMVKLRDNPLSHLTSPKGTVHCISEFVGCFVLLA